MIRAKIPDRQLFYCDEEIARPSRTNYYIRLNEAVSNWGEFCEPLGGCFSLKKDGRPVDPTVYFKIFLIGYLEGIVEDTDLAERISDSIAIREFLGYGLSERPPDHSSIGRVRGAFGKGEALQLMLEDTVSRCAQAGLVDGKLVAVDSVLLPANADMASLVSMKTGLTVREHLKHCRDANLKGAVGNEEFRSTGDPDARIARKKGSPTRMYYKATHVTDSKNQVIVAANLSGADIGECEAAKPALKQTKLRLSTASLALGTVVADAGYDDGAFHAYIEEQGAIPLTNYQASKSPKEAGFAKSDFVYDPENDLYRCPQGKLLSLAGSDRGRAVYTSKTSECQECPYRHQCLAKSQRYRVVRREPSEASRERNIALCHTDKGREQLKARKVIVEPPFAHMKRCGGLSRLNCRTQNRVLVKVIVAAIAWNLMKLTKALGKGQTDALARFWDLIFVLKRPIPRAIFA